MNDTVFWRLVWKEYRLQRSWWIAMAVLAVILQLLIRLLGSPESLSRFKGFYVVALLLTALYAVGCGATLFATEHETGTFELQRMLPVSARRLFFAKVGFAVASTALLMVILWGMAWTIAGGQMPEPVYLHALWAILGLGTVEALVWGVFMSLVLRRPLVAGILAMTMSWLCAQLMATYFGPSYYSSPYVQATPLRAIFAALVALADCWLGCRWFREKPLGPRVPLRFRQRGPNDGGAARPSRLFPLHRASGFVRLMWQGTRQSASAAGAVCVLFVAVVVAVAWVWLAPNAKKDVEVPILIVFCSATASLIGSSVFLGDQRGRGFRFLAEHGVRPGTVWLSRHIPWLSLVGLMVAAVLPLLLLGSDGVIATLRESCDMEGILRQGGIPVDALIAPVSQIVTLLIAVGLAYGSGQFWSMFVRSGVLASFFGLVSTAVLLVWLGLMVILEVNLAWSVAPIVLVLVLATWLRAGDWIAERSSWRVRFRAGLSVALPAAILLAAVPLYRINQFPDVSPGFDPDSFARPATEEERATLAMYRRAYDCFVPPHRFGRETMSQEDFLEANRESIAITLEASQHEACSFFDPNAKVPDPNPARIAELGFLIYQSAGPFEARGDLEAAMDRFWAALRISRHLRQRTLQPELADGLETIVYNGLPHWAAHPNQTPERLRAFLAQLAEFQRSLPARSDTLKVQYLVLRRILSGDIEMLGVIETDEGSIYSAKLGTTLLPWEKVRAVRMLNAQTAQGLAFWKPPADPARIGAHVYIPDTPVFNESAPKGQRYPSFLVTPAVDWRLREHNGLALAQGLTKIDTQRRVVLLQLVIQAWKLEHGELPDTLDELVGPYLESVPLDLYTGEPIRYFPEGLPVRSIVRDTHCPVGLFSSMGNPIVYGTGEMSLAAGTPFLWVAGPNVSLRFAELPEDDFRRYCMMPEGPFGTNYTPRTECEVWASGVWFLLPR